MKIIFNKTLLMKKNCPKFALTAFLFSLIAACSASVSPNSRSDQLHVVATTTIVADVVRQVGGKWVDVQILLPAGTDPHSFDPIRKILPKSLMLI